MFKKFDLKMGLKIAGGVIFGLLILGLVASLGGFAFRTAFNISPSYRGDKIMTSHYSDYDGYSMDEEFGGMEMKQLSSRNVMMSEWGGGYATGNDLEDFEVTEYSAIIKTGRLDKVCGEVKELKTMSYVIFENSNEGDSYCDYRFKVEKDREAEILEVVRGLKPENLDINTDSIKKQIEDFTSEEEILTKRLIQIEETLEDAQKAYDEVTELATNSRDVETLAKIINDKITLIEKLTTERLNTKSNLDRLGRAKLSQLDKLEYTFFTVTIYENLIIDFEALGDSWERELKNFVQEFNNMLQGVSVRLLSFGTKLIQILLYLTIALLVAKYGWRGAKFVWKK